MACRESLSSRTRSPPCQLRRSCKHHRPLSRILWLRLHSMKLARRHRKSHPESPCSTSSPPLTRSSAFLVESSQSLQRLLRPNSPPPRIRPRRRRSSHRSPRTRRRPRMPLPWVRALRAGRLPHRHLAMRLPQRRSHRAMDLLRPLALVSLRQLRLRRLPRRPCLPSSRNHRPPQSKPVHRIRILAHAHSSYGAVTIPLDTTASDHLRVEDEKAVQVQPISILKSVESPRTAGRVMGITSGWMVYTMKSELLCYQGRSQTDSPPQIVCA